MGTWQEEITGRSLHEECVSIVSECVHRMIDDASADWSDVLWESVDSHRWVIYTGAAQQLLAVSHFDDYAIEEMGCSPVAEGGGINWSALAFGALIGQCFDTDPDDETMQALRNCITTEDRNADLEGDETFADLLEMLEAVR